MYYNPGNPSSSALIVEYDTIDLFFVALGMIFLIIPLIPGGIKDRFRGRNLKTNVTGIPTQTGYSNQNQNDSKLYENTFDEGNRPTEPVTQQISQQFSGSCQNCGNSIKTGAKFCVDCGEKF